MRIIISPAKKMNFDDSISYNNFPVFLKHSEVLMNYIKSLNFEQAKKLWSANDKIIRQNMERFESMDLKKKCTPAIFAYEGIQYQYLSPSTLEDKMLEYIEKNLRILSGFYGVLKPMDAVTPYRLEMQAKIDINKFNNLYDFWEDKLYNEVLDSSKIIINLASKEYSKSIEKYLKKDDIYINCTFAELVNGKPVQKATYAKMARGEMVRFMAQNNIDNIEDLKKFKGLNHNFNYNLSTDKDYVFVREDK